MDDNLLQIISETTRLCREVGMAVSPALVAYMAGLQEIQTAWKGVAPEGSSLLNELDARAVASISQQLQALLRAKDEPLLTVAKMQVGMEVAFKAQREGVEREQAEVEEKAGMLARAITGPRAIRNPSSEEYERLYRKVQEYVCVRAGV